MLREFFCARRCCVALGAWVGLVLIVAYAGFAAYTKGRINAWYAEFYDLLGEASGLFGPEESASGPPLTQSVDENALASKTQRLTAMLWEFGGIIAPLVLVSPFAKLVRSFWAFHWRVALMRRYLELWDPTSSVEGASQRIHEDTQRFASALQGCLAVVLDAALTLVVFAPLLVELGARAVAPWYDEFRVLGDGWLVVTAVTAATLGLGGAMVFGKHLVLLEFANQRVEAALRRLLVLREVEGQPRYRGVTGGAGFDRDIARAIADLRRNYHRLFRHFALLNTWLSAFDQACVLLPYFLVAPLVFAADPGRRITLGVLVQVANCFDKVFGSLSVVADSWGAVNDFRSTLLRLREFEANLLRGVPPATTTRQGAGGARGGGGGGGGGGCWPWTTCALPWAALGAGHPPPDSPTVEVEIVGVVDVVEGAPPSPSPSASASASASASYRASAGEARASVAI